MDSPEIEQRVHLIISRVLNVDPSSVTNEAILATDLAADSLDTVEVIMMMEEEFGLQLGEANVKLNTVRDVVDYIVAKAPSVDTHAG